MTISLGFSYDLDHLDAHSQSKILFCKTKFETASNLLNYIFQLSENHSKRETAMAPKSNIDYKFQQKNGNQNSSRRAWKLSLLWIRLLGTAILLHVVGRFLLSNNDMNLFYPHDIHHIESWLIFNLIFTQGEIS